MAVVEGALLVCLAMPLWAKAVDKFPDKRQATVIDVVGQQFNWNVLYADKDGEFGRQEMRFVNATNTLRPGPERPARPRTTSRSPAWAKCMCRSTSR